MKAMLLRNLSNRDETQKPLEFVTIPDPVPGEQDLLVKVSVCGVCHTELDEIEGRTPPSFFPIVLGHQVVGRVQKTGAGASRFKPGDRVGIAWIYSACGKCKFCLAGNENLCPYFRATGRDANGGYAEYMTVPENFVYKIPDRFTDAEAVPLLCAGAVGYRSLRLTGLQNGQNLGLVGFGASGHLVLKTAQALYKNSGIYVFSRSKQEREFAQELGATWTGDMTDEPPVKLNGMIDTTPAWKPIVEALKNLERGGRLVINAIRKEQTDKDALLQLDYATHLWLEKEIKSVANVTRKDVSEFLELAAKNGIRSEFQEFALPDANAALAELRARNIRGAKVLLIE